MIRHRIRRLKSLLSRYDDRARVQEARPLKAVHDVLDLLEEQAEAIRSDPWSSAIAKARALAYLASVARRTMETGVIADRLEILETILRERKARR